MVESLLRFSFIIPTILSYYFYSSNKKNQKFIQNQNEIVKSLNSNMFSYLSILGDIDSSKLTRSSKRSFKNLKTEIEVDRRLLTILTEASSAIAMSKALSYFYDNPPNRHLNVFLIAEKRLKNKCKDEEWVKVYATITEIIKKCT